MGATAFCLGMCCPRGRPKNQAMVAENISASQYNPEAAINTWLNSSGHRANMLSYSYADLGVGIAYSANGAPYYTQVFGR